MHFEYLYVRFSFQIFVNLLDITNKRYICIIIEKSITDFQFKIKFYPFKLFSHRRDIE